MKREFYFFDNLLVTVIHYLLGIITISVSQIGKGGIEILNFPKFIQAVLTGRPATQDSWGGKNWVAYVLLTVTLNEKAAARGQKLTEVGMCVSGERALTVIMST